MQMSCNIKHLAYIWRISFKECGCWTSEPQFIAYRFKNRNRKKLMNLTKFPKSVKIRFSHP